MGRLWAIASKIGDILLHKKTMQDPKVVLGKSDLYFINKILSVTIAEVDSLYVAVESGQSINPNEDLEMIGLVKKNLETIKTAIALKALTSGTGTNNQVEDAPESKGDQELENFCSGGNRLPLSVSDPALQAERDQFFRELVLMIAEEVQKKAMADLEVSPIKRMIEQLTEERMEAMVRQAVREMLRSAQKETN